MKSKKAKKAVKVAKKSIGQHYSPEQRTELLGQYNDLRKQGVKAVDAAKKVGVTYITLHSWAGKKNPKKPAVKKQVKRPPKQLKRGLQKKAAVIASAPETAAPTIEILTPDGFQIKCRGISFSEVEAALRDLRAKKPEKVSVDLTAPAPAIEASH